MDGWMHGWMAGRMDDRLDKQFAWSVGFDPQTTTDPSLSELDVNQVEHGLEHGPLLVHFLEEGQLPGIDVLLQSEAVAEPDRQKQSSLGPGEDPGNGPERVDASIGPPLGGAASDVHLPELGSGSVGVEEADEDIILALEHGLLVLFCGNVGQFLHGCSELRAWEWRWGEGVPQHSRGVSLQRPFGDLSAGKVPANGFTLNGQAKVASFQGALRLGQESQVRRATSASDGATAAVEEGHVDTVLLADLQDLLHGHMQLPGRGKFSSILHRVRVAQHDLLAALNVLLVPWHAKGGVDHLGGIDQVIAGLEEGADTHELLHASDLLQQAHSKDIRGSPGHGDAVSTQGFDGQFRDGLVGSQDFLDDVAGFEIVRQEWPLRLDLLHEPVTLLLLGPGAVFAQA